jgi:hypothetical protein
MTARLSRISPIENMLYKDWVIPAGVSVSVLFHRSYSIADIP